MNDERFPYAGPPELLPVITAALKRVVDPEVALDFEKQHSKQYILTSYLEWLGRET